MFKKILGVIALLFLSLLAVLLYNTFTFSSLQQPAKNVNLLSPKAGFAERFAKSLRFPTISSYKDPHASKAAFQQLHQHIQTSFPLIHKTLKRDVIGGYSLLYTWQGSVPTLPPALLLAHQDIVPIAKVTRNKWKQPPFSGKIVKGEIWGRGALDDKAGVLGSLEAVEALLAKGFRPKRTFYLAFGHDEEVGGLRGAAKIAAHLKAQGVTLHYVLDEGLMVLHDNFDPVKQPVAMIGIAEKGYISLRLSVTTKGGHSSIPPKRTAVGILSTAIHKLEHNPMPMRLKGPVRALLRHTGPEMAFPLKLVMANLWLFGPVVKSIFSKKNTTNALLRSTTAVTMIKGSPKDNILASVSSAIVNCRILPGDSVKDVVAHIKRVIDDPRVKVTFASHKQEPSFVSDINTKSFATIKHTVREVFPDTVITPGLMVGGTDSRHFRPLTKQIFRFFPIRFGKHDLPRLHGINEKIAVKNYRAAIQFYMQLIKNSQP